MEKKHKQNLLKQVREKREQRKKRGQPWEPWSGRLNLASPSSSLQIIKLESKINEDPGI